MRSRRLQFVLNLFVQSAVLAMFVLTFAPMLLAQGAEQPIPAPLDPQAAVYAAFAAALPFLVEGIKKIVPGLPKILVWAAAPILGAALGYVGTFITGAAPGGWKGFLLGLIAIALREAQNTFAQHRLGSS